MTSENILAVDIGSNTIKCLLGRANPDGSVERMPSYQGREQTHRSVSGGTAASGRYSGSPPEILMDILREVWYRFVSQGGDDNGKRTAQGAV